MPGGLFNISRKRALEVEPQASIFPAYSGCAGPGGCAYPSQPLERVVRKAAFATLRTRTAMPIMKNATGMAYQG